MYNFYEPKIKRDLVNLGTFIKNSHDKDKQCILYHNNEVLVTCSLRELQEYGDIDNYYVDIEYSFYKTKIFIRKIINSTNNVSKE